MKRIKHEIFQDGYEFDIPKENIIATELFDHDYGNGELISHIQVWYVVEENLVER